MKTAEEYIADWQQKASELQSIDAGIGWCDEARIEFWNQALLDAYKAGMTEAEQVKFEIPMWCRDSLSSRKVLELCREAILSARDRKTSL